MANEILFLVEDATEGGYIARALGYSILTEADSWEELKRAIRDAVKCHFDEGEQPDLRLTTTQGGEHHITIPRHSSLRVGTLSAILRDVAEHLGIPRQTLMETLFGK
jgi:hypothetical protein